MLLQLTAADVICVNGNVVFTFEGIAHLDPRTLADTNVIIDGRIEHVGGVETYPVNDPTGFPFGLAVTRPHAAKCSFMLTYLDVGQWDQ